MRALREDGLAWFARHRRESPNNVLAVSIGIQFLLMVVLLLMLPFDSMEIGGRARWAKPLNFTQSMAVYLMTVMWLLDYLRAAKWWKSCISWGVSACLTIAIFCITLQAARGTTSHFNTDTPFDGAVSMIMDIVDPVNSVFVVILLVFAFRSMYDLSRPVVWGIASGLLLFLVSSAVGELMVFRGSAVVGVEPEGPGLPLLNWSIEGGDFRPAHFLGIHAVQVLPVVGWLVNRREHWSMAAKLTAVLAAAALIFAIIGFTVYQAVQGVPLIRL